MREALVAAVGFAVLVVVAGFGRDSASPALLVFRRGPVWDARFTACTEANPSIMVVELFATAIALPDAYVWALVGSFWFKTAFL